MPKSASSNSSRVQRVRSVTAKPNVKPEKKKVKKQVEDLKKVIKQEPVEMPVPVATPATNGLRFNGAGEFVSPKRAVKNLSRDYSELHDTLRAVKSDDCFTHLTELPAEQMDLLMNCDIRFSLPAQGVPRALPPGPPPCRPSVAEMSKPAVIEPSKSFPTVKASSPKIARASPDSSSSTVLKVKPVQVAVAAKAHGVKNLFPPPPNPIGGSIQELLESYRDREEVQAALPSLVPGQYNHIYVRLYETFAQVNLASPKVKLKGSLSTAAMEEVVHLLSYVAAAPRLRGLLVTGVGNIFCQGIDLTELCIDKQERRKEQASQMAAALERLVLSLAAFPKLLVAAVNGAAVGLGVTMLPLFDIVYANDKAQFSTFYTR